MRISSVTITNFRCFGPEPTTIALEDFCAFIGNNGTGKTAALWALCRLFGPTQSERRLTADDFHVPASERLESSAERRLVIECRLDFPELEGEGQDTSAIPPVFNQMIVSSEGGQPYCRVRLDGVWLNTGIPGGDVTEQIYWVTTAQPTVGDLEKVRMTSLDRSRVQVYYVPALRDTNRQLANVSGTLLNQLLKAVKWAPDLQEQVGKAATELKEAFLTVEAIRHINDTSKRSWAQLYDDETYQNPSLEFVGEEFGDVLGNTSIVFQPSPTGRRHDLGQLSDGQRALFYFAFLNSLFAIQSRVATDHHANWDENSKTLNLSQHISYETLRHAHLTLFCIEEPENHLSPHYLGRVLAQLSRLSENSAAQVIVSSHCPQILGRIQPEEVRHFRLGENSTVSVKPIELPAKAADAFKYVKEGVQAFPELYFSRVVLLCEGDSEQVVIDRMTRLLSEEPDLLFLSIVPLGGRHVSHFWRLLRGLGIPYVTLLDLDRERATGGWARIKYVLEQIRDVMTAEEWTDLQGRARKHRIQVDANSLGKLHEQDPADGEAMTQYVSFLRRYRVFFSEPLDLDLAMLMAFPEHYHATSARGPQRKDVTEPVVRQVLGAAGGDGLSYAADELLAFAWYAHLFLGRGKPSTHAVAWANITKDEIAKAVPPTYRLLIKRVEELAAKGRS